MRQFIKNAPCVCGEPSTYQQGNGRNTIFYCGKSDCAIKMGEDCDYYFTCWHSSRYCQGCDRVPPVEFNHLLDTNENWRISTTSTSMKRCIHSFCDDCIEHAICKFCAIDWGKLMGSIYSGINKT